MHDCFIFYYFLLPGKFLEHLSIRLMFKLFPAYCLPNPRNAANFSTGNLQDSMKVPSLDMAGTYLLYFFRLKKLMILDYCYLFELYTTITNLKFFQFLQKLTQKTVLSVGSCAPLIVRFW